MTIDTGYFATMMKVIASRKDASPEESYIAKLFGKGRSKIAQKVGEEATEVAIAAVGTDKKAIINESADLLFHMAVLWSHADITADEVFAELKSREGISGLEEKANRKG